MMDLDQLNEIMRAFSRSEYRECRLVTDEVSLELKRTDYVQNPPADTAVCSAGVQAAAEEEAGAPAAGSGEQDRADGCKTVKAPMAGTFYTSAKPGDPPYVTAGSRVSKGDTLGLLEAMKVISEITAPVSGTVEAVLLEDAQFAEYDMPLFRIRDEA